MLCICQNVRFTCEQIPVVSSTSRGKVMPRLLFSTQSLGYRSLRTEGKTLGPAARPGAERHALTTSCLLGPLLRSDRRLRHFRFPGVTPAGHVSLPTIRALALDGGVLDAELGTEHLLELTLLDVMGIGYHQGYSSTCTLVTNKGSRAMAQAVISPFGCLVLCAQLCRGQNCTNARIGQPIKDATPFPPVSNQPCLAQFGQLL